MSRLKSISILAGIALATAFWPACNGYGTGPGTNAYDAELALLRNATRNFGNADVAGAAGFTLRLTGCMTDPVRGGMGFHLGSPERIDGTVELERPEALLFEPRENDVPALVAVEYLVPFDAWTPAAPPQLMGQTFARNEEFGVWALHVWLYKENPSGLFADWNPRVSCAAAPPEPAMDTVHVDGVRVTPQTIQFLAIGETRQLQVAISPPQATDQAVLWESTDPGVASVDAAGQVTARAPGVGVLVTAFSRDGRRQSSANVSVLP